MTGTAEQQWTIKRLLDWTTEFFQKTEGVSPRLEAEMLLAEALECARIDLYTQFDQVPTQERLDRFRAWVKRRSAGEPVAYIVGHKEFYSLRFEVDSNVLIPRPETEHVVVAVLEAAKRIVDRPLRIIDLGTGSGCIAVTLANYLDNCKIAAIDISPEAIAVAKRNAEHHGQLDKIRFFQGNLFDALPVGSGQVHIVASNPPYIGSDESGTVDRQVSQFEPHVALYAGPDGTQIIQQLVDQSPQILLPGGFLIFETSPIIMDRCLDLIEKSQFQLTEVVKDIAGHRRVVVAQNPL